MKYINKNDLIIEELYFASGNYSDIHLVSYNNEIYCFKEFNYIFPNEIINNLEYLTYIKFDKEYLTPQYIIKNNNKVIGYLSKFYKTNHYINPYNLSKEEKIKILKNARETITKLHSKYKIIHGDLNSNNILYDNSYKTYLLDFDSALKFNQLPKSLESFSSAIINYLNYFKYDYKIDIYKFNYTTLKILYDINNEDELITLLENKTAFNKNIKKLTKELILNPEDLKEEYSGEFIIDYVN